MAQTSYTQNYTAALAGMIASVGTAPNAIIDPQLLTATDASAPFGAFVSRDAADGSVKLPASANDVTLTGVGFIVRRMAKEPVAADGGTLENVSGQMVPCLRFGRIWVTTELAVAYGDPVYIRYSANGTGKLQRGAARNDGDTSHAALLAGARFVDTVAAAGVARVEWTGGGNGATGAIGATGATGPTP